jgi:aldose sugar dehydrogenase
LPLDIIQVISTIAERKLLLKMRTKFVLSVIVVPTSAASVVVVLLILISTNSSIIVWGPEVGPMLHDDRLDVQLVAEGLDSPTSMRFLNETTLLVLEKNKGQVRIILDGKLLEEPAIQLEVATGPEQGLLGIETWNGDNDTTSSVFLYLTESYHGKTRNVVYKYLYDENKKSLENKTLILDLPGEPGPFHNGGKIAIGPRDGYIYAVIGDVSSGGGILDNQFPGRPPNDKSVILRVDRDTGSPVQSNPFYNNYTGDMEKLRRYYAYGIRNSFGMDFEPVTGKLWITENGDHAYDEINIVETGFNSGWHKIMGPIGRTNMTVEKDLIIFDSGAKYQDPIFSWYTPVGVTDIEFLNSTKLGEKYDDNLFVGDINYGNLYFFEVNEDRTGLTFRDPRLLDLVADPVKEGEDSELTSLIVGEGFGRITDIETGPDGLLYVLTYEDGKIYRITKSES